MFIRKDILLLLFSLLLLVGCGGVDYDSLWEDSTRSDTEVPDSKSRNADLPPFIGKRVSAENDKKFPWQIWNDGRDLAGLAVEHRPLIEGDELWKRGQYADALVRYREARVGVKNRGLLDALVVRIAGAELAVGNPEGALRTVSDYFRITGRTEDAVDAPFSLLFAFAYGIRGDVDQSLAWFSRTNRLHAGLGGYHQISEDAVRALLRVPSTHEVNRLSERWKNDSFVSALIGEEYRRRASPDYREPMGVRFTRFWETPRDGLYASANGGSGGLIGSGDKAVVGVILPLSGNYSPLGTKVKGGIELAVLGQQAGEQFQFEYRDSVGDPLRAVSAFREFDNSQMVPVAIGPLLSNAAVDVSHIARGSRVSLVTFSKRSTFIPGNGVFRLGPTLESQLTSLLAVAGRSKGMQRIASVTSADSVGRYYAEVFREFATQRGYEIVFESSYAPSIDTDLVTIASEIEQIDVDGIFFPGALKEASRFVGNLSKQKRSKSPLLGLGVWDNPRELAQSRTILNGAIFVSPFFTKSKRPIIQKFIQSYKRRYGSAPDFLAAQGFDVTTLVIAALRRATDLGVSFQEALQTVDVYEGLTGDIHVSPTGEIERTFQVVEIRRGTIVPVTKADYRNSLDTTNSRTRASIKSSYIMRGDEVIRAPEREKLEGEIQRRSYLRESPSDEFGETVIQ